MHKRIEDLLTLRDGEPIDARLKARLSNDRQAAAELERLGKLKEDLRALPELEPPVAARSEVVAAMGAAVGRRRVRTRRRAAGIAVTAGAAAVLAAVAFLALRSGDSTSPVAAASPAGESSSDADYTALIQESTRLERLLAALPAQRRIMNVGTAGTIAGLENQIAFIDDQLTVGTIAGIEPEYKQALWRERVDVMNALVQVRYAQSQAFWFGDQAYLSRIAQ